MTTPPENAPRPDPAAAPRDAANWAKPVDKLNVPSAPGSTPSINVNGRQIMSPMQGFGQMWQKTYSVRLSGAKETPIEVMTAWKANFPKFWPPGNLFYAPITGITPGEVGLINVNMGGGMRLSTGVMVIYADEESFTFMTPEGHMFAGWITFSTYEQDGATVAQVQALIRANDPIYEMGFRLGFGHKSEDKFWRDTLKNLAASFGVNGQVTHSVVCVDPRTQWSKAWNVRHNAAIRTTIYRITWPARRVRSAFTRTT